MTFSNKGSQAIDEIYLAVELSEIFNFKIYRFNFRIEPNESRSELIKIKMPIFKDSTKSNFWKVSNKCIFLYRTGSNFRLLRTVNVFNVSRVAEIRAVSCERLSKNLHLLSFCVRYEHSTK